MLAGQPGDGGAGPAWWRAALHRLGQVAAGERRGHRSWQAGLAIAAAVGAAIVTGVAGLAYLTSAGTGNATAAGRADHDARRSLAVNGPLRVLSLTPSAGAAGVTGATTVQITFSAPIALNSALPEISPPTRGRWLAFGRVLAFAPQTSFAPDTRFTLQIPGGAAGLRSVAGGLLARPVVARFSTERYSPLRLAQLLGELGYLPLSWQADARGRMLTGAGLPAQQAMAFTPPAGTFSWAPGYPAALRSQWQLGWSGPVVRGAVMAFQAQHGLAVNGLATSRLWRALLAAAARGQRNEVGYTYAIASKGAPERLTIWHDGRVVVRSLANTGIAVSPTASGTFPVYLRFRHTIMSGTNPDGSHYSDPVSFVSYFNGGDAVHYFPRGSYGWPQSLGCVELPYQSAARAWPYLTYGSLVTVTG